MTVNPEVSVSTPWLSRSISYSRAFWMKLHIGYIRFDLIFKVKFNGVLNYEIDMSLIVTTSTCQKCKISTHDFVILKPLIETYDRYLKTIKQVFSFIKNNHCIHWYINQTIMVKSALIKFNLDIYDCPFIFWLDMCFSVIFVQELRAFRKKMGLETGLEWVRVKNVNKQVGVSRRQKGIPWLHANTLWNSNKHTAVLEQLHWIWYSLCGCLKSH